MAKLIPLSEVPVRGGARNAERAARAKHGAKSEALAAAQHELVEAPGTYGTAHPASYGWCCSRVAAEAVSESSLVRMPGGTQHRTLAVRP